MNKPKLLVAGTPPAIETIRHLFGAEADCLPAQSLDAAIHSFEQHPDLILCNVRFDESRMFELLQAAKTRSATRETPFVCFRLAPLPRAWRRCLEAAELRAVVLAHLARP